MNERWDKRLCGYRYVMKPHTEPATDDYDMMGISAKFSTTLLRSQVEKYRAGDSLVMGNWENPKLKPKTEITFLILLSCYHFSAANITQLPIPAWTMRQITISCILTCCLWGRCEYIFFLIFWYSLGIVQVISYYFSLFTRILKIVA